MKRADLLFILCMVTLLVYAVSSILFPESPSFLVSVYAWLLSFSLVMGYGGAFLIALLGNATVLIPFPYIGLPFILGGLKDSSTHLFVFDPILVGLVSGAGCTIGEIVTYLLGRLGRRFVDTEQMNGFTRYVDRHPRATPLMIFLLAATPIPDDVLVVPLGAAKYAWWRILPPLFTGKTAFMMGVSFAGRLGLEWVGSLVGSMESPGIAARMSEIVGLVLVVVAIYLVVRINWNRSVPDESGE